MASSISQQIWQLRFSTAFVVKCSVWLALSSVPANAQDTEGGVSAVPRTAESKFSRKDIFELAVQGVNYTISYLPEIMDEQAKAVDTSAYTDLSGSAAARKVVQELTAARQDYKARRQRADVVATGTRVFYGGLGAYAAGPVGMAAGLGFASIIENLIDAGMTDAYRQMIADTDAIFEYNLNLQSDGRIRAAASLLRSAEDADTRGDTELARQLRDQAVQETLESGAFVERVLRSEACEAMGAEACQLAVQSGIRNNTLRLDLNERELRSIRDLSERNSERIKLIKSELDRFVITNGIRIDQVEETQKAILDEITSIDRHLDDLQYEVAEHDRQIGYIQHSLWRRMSAAERLDAIKSGTFFPSMSRKDRSELEKSLEIQSQDESDRQKLQDRVKLIAATSDLANELSRLGVVDPNVADAVSKVSFGSTIVLQASELSNLSGLSLWTSGISLAANTLKIFGRRKTDPEQKRFKAIMRAMGVIDAKLDEVLKLQRLTLESLQIVDYKIDRLERTLDRRFDRVEAKIDYLTDLVISAVILPGSDACARFIRYGADRFALDVSTRNYDTYTNRLEHWKNGGTDRDACVEYVTRSSTVYRQSGAAVDAAFQVSQRSDSELSALKQREYRLLVEGLSALTKYSEQSPECLNYVMLVLSEAPTNFIGARGFFDFMRNVQMAGCGRTNFGPQNAILRGNYDDAPWAWARWSMTSPQIEAGAVLAFADVAMLITDHLRLTIRNRRDATVSQITLDQMTDGELWERFDHEGLRVADRDLRRVLDLIDLAAAQSAMRSGLPLLPFIEEQMIGSRFGFAVPDSDKWAKYRQGRQIFEARPEVVRLRSEQKRLAAQRDSIASTVFEASGLYDIEFRDAASDQRLDELSNIADSISQIQRDLEEQRSIKILDDSSISDLEHAYLSELRCSLSGGGVQLEASQEFWLDCFSKLIENGELVKTPLSSYLFAAFLIDNYPEIAQNFWVYLTLRNMTEGPYGSRMGCSATNSERKCSYVFGGASGNRKQTSRFSLEIAREYYKPSLLRQLLPDFILIDVETESETSPNGHWGALWVGPDGSQRITPVPATTELVGELSRETYERLGGSITYTAEVGALVQKREEVLMGIIGPDWLDRTVGALENESQNQPQATGRIREAELPDEIDVLISLTLLQ